MPNKTKKLLTTTIFLTILLFSSFYAILTPTAHAAEMTNQQKGLTIINNVFDVDLSKYTITTQEYLQNADALYHGVIAQDNVAYELTSDTGTLKMLYTFADGRVQMIQVLQRAGILSLTKAVSHSGISNAQSAKNFLTNYQAYTANPLFGELKTTLDKVYPGVNLTKVFDDKVLEVTTYPDHTNFKWYYTFSGAIAPYSKFVAIECRGGFIEAFVDNWQFYNVGTNDVNLSEEDAISIALEAAKAHSWSVKLDVNALDTSYFNNSNAIWASLIFDSSLNASKTRSANVMELYPVWRVGIALNRWYGQMYGIQVDIWADTKEIRSIQEAWSTLPSPAGVPIENLSDQINVSSENKLNQMMTAFPAISLVSIAFLWLSWRKKVDCFSAFKRHVLKLSGIILCLLLLTTLAGELGTANATTRGAVVWGSESTGQNDAPPRQRKSSTEISCQRDMAERVAEDFGDNGYTGNNGINHQGTSSSKTQILSDIAYLTDNNDYVAVVDFDHGIFGYPYLPTVEAHYMIEDNRGTYYDDDGGGPNPADYHTNTSGVYDSEIYSSRQQGQVIFAFINTCLSANFTLGEGMIGNPQRALGMPYAWMGREVLQSEMSSDGYGDPDGEGQCYIGFPWGSASLEQNIPYNTGYYYGFWIMDFFNAALYPDISVNQALDSASRENYGTPFSSNPLRTGFQAYWWPDAWPQANCYMTVLGDGNIRLKNYDPSIDSVGRSTVTGPSYYDNLQPYVSYNFNAAAADSQSHQIHYYFDWGDGTGQWVPQSGYVDSGENVQASHSWTTTGEKTITVTAQCENGEWNTGPAYYGVHVGNWYWLNVEAVDDYYYDLVNTPIYVNDYYIGTYSASVFLPEDWYEVYVEPEAYWENGLCYCYDTPFWTYLDGPQSQTLTYVTGW
jgi:hypothetical protein